MEPNHTITNKLFVIEGGDGAGKGTQIKLLYQKLLSERHQATLFDFPQYETSQFGKLCGEALSGKHGDFRNLSPHLASLPFLLDRLNARGAILDALIKGIVICNRYTPSNVAYQAAKLKGKKQKEFISFLEEAEYGEHGLPEPTLVVYLYVPTKIAHGLVAKKEARGYMGKKKGARDQHEADVKFQKTVAQTYLKLAKERPKKWVTINCAPRGKMLPPEVIHELVMQKIEKHLG